jgi:hypothetical protein
MEWTFGRTANDKITDESVRGTFKDRIHGEKYQVLAGNCQPIALLVHVS